MTIKTILVPLAGDAQHQTPALETALALAHNFQAHVNVLYLVTEPEDLLIGLGSEMYAEAIGNMLSRVTEWSQHARRRYDELTERHDVAVVSEAAASSSASSSWIERRDDKSSAVERLGRLADLTVVGIPKSDVDNLLFNAALSGTGRPVLMTAAAAALDIGHRIAVAWNGSAEAARAVAGAMPFLKRAEKVTLLTAESEQTTAARAGEAKTFLARHGVEADTLVFAKNANPPVGKALLAHCQELNADLLVMGAYSHSRVHEVLFGGVTSYMLEHAHLPVLMAH